MDDLEQRILDAVAPLSGIETLVLFGSRATGRARPDSDLDWTRHRWCSANESWSTAGCYVARTLGLGSSSDSRR